MKMKKTVLLLMIGVLCFCGCGVQTQDTKETVSVQEEVKETVPVQEEVVEEEMTEVVEETQKAEESVFSQLPESFFFSSGAGGWWTELYIEEDGTFYGQYHDSEMGSTGEGYPNGTCYICDFEGKFATPVKVSEYVYSTSVESINYEEPDKEYIEDEIKYITSVPYGLDNSGEILIYLNGTPKEEIAEGFIYWMPGCEMTTDTLDCYGIYNVNEEAGFMGYLE